MTAKKAKPVVRVTAKPAAGATANRGTSSGPMTKPRGTGGRVPRTRRS